MAVGICPVCKKERDDLRIREPEKAEKEKSESSKPIVMCDDCWEGAARRAGGQAQSK